MWDADFGRHTSFQAINNRLSGALKAPMCAAFWPTVTPMLAGQFHVRRLLNRFTRCANVQRGRTSQGIISVDADREQSSWTADAWNIGNVLLYNHPRHEMIDKVVHDYATAQMTNGDFPPVARRKGPADSRMVLGVADVAVARNTSFQAMRRFCAKLARA